MKWFGYVYDGGGLQAKPYREPLDIWEAESSPFVRFVCGPFEVNGRDEALEKVKEEYERTV